MRAIFMLVACIAGWALSAHAQERARLAGDVQRLVQMTEQVGALNLGPPNQGVRPAESRLELARRLRETVWTFNAIRSRYCAEGRNVEASCGRAYSPWWLTEPADAQPGFADLADRAEEVRRWVLPFWIALCADARAREPNEDLHATICAVQ